MEKTPAVTALIAAYRTLSAGEQDELAARVEQHRAQRDAGSRSEGERMLASMLLIAERAGWPLSPDAYRSGYAALRAEGADIEPIHRVIRHFGSWRLSKEAVTLAEITTVRRIEARFASRKLGKIWRYTEQTLRETLQRAIADHGRVVTVAEFAHWRERQLELARAAGEDFHLPSANPYRKRWKTWPQTLAHFGYDGEAATGRFAQR
ncbi:MAG: hypothetical protein WKF96_02940 [Solirubrobacteraceae bacterium]